MLPPAVPYRGIAPFRYVDHAIFPARDDETDELVDLVAIYRGVLLYGASGDGKSSLVNAGLLPALARRRLRPERIRVQPRDGGEIVVERIPCDEDGAQLLASSLADAGDEAAQIVLSVQAFEEAIRAACGEHRPLLVFDQFEEIVTLFEHADGVAAQRRLVDMLVRLLREPLAVKLVFVFREDYLGAIKQLLGAVPELVDQALRLEPLTVAALPAIIRGPFDRHPGHFERELSPALAGRLTAALERRFADAELSLSEVETVALRLWQASDPEQLLRERNVQGILEDYLGESLDALAPDLRAAAVAVLAQMVTRAGTRNVVSADDIVQRARDGDDGLSPALLQDALDRLERDSRLIRRERRRDIHLYEITSEFLVPWIRARRDEARRASERAGDERRRELERERERRRLRVLGSIAGALALVVVVVVTLAAVALHSRAQAERQGEKAREQAAVARSTGLESAALGLTESRPDLALLLGLGADEALPSAASRGSLVAGLGAAKGSGEVIGILHGHAGWVNGVAASPDGHTLASSGDDGTLRLWDARTNRQLGGALRGHVGPVNRLAFDADGRMLASGGEDGTVRLWDPRSHRQIGKLRGNGAPVDDVAFSRDGSMLASAEEGTSARENPGVRLWDPRTRRPIATLRRGKEIVNGVAFSPDGRRLAAAVDDGNVRLWDVRAQRLRATLRDAGGAVHDVAFRPDGRTLASAADDGIVRLWDLRSREPRARLRGHDGAVRDVAFRADGRGLASAGADGTVRLWRGRALRPAGVLRGHTAEVSALAFLGDGGALATSGEDEVVRVWDLRQRARSLRGHAEQVTGVAFSRDGRTIVSASADEETGSGTVRRWDARTRDQRGAALRSAAVTGIALSPDARTLATAGADGTVRLWDARGPRGAPLLKSDEAVTSVAFSPDARMLASSGLDSKVRLWDVGTRRSLGMLSGHEGIVYRVAFSPDGRRLASAGADRTIRIWDVRSGALVGTLSGHADRVLGVAFGPRGRTLASASFDGTVRIWDVDRQRQLGQPLRGHAGAAGSVAFSPDGQLLASSGADQTVRLWDARTGRALGGPLRGAGGVYQVTFSPDGRTIAASDGSTVRLWEDIVPRGRDELRAMVCRLVGHGLLERERAQYAPSIAPFRACT